MKTFAILLLMLAVVKPVKADVILEAPCIPLKDRWCQIVINGVIIPPSGITVPIVICLDDIPGGLDGVPTVNVKPLNGVKRNAVAVTRKGFRPVAGGDDLEDDLLMPYVSVVLQGPPGTEVQLVVHARGQR